MNKFIRFVNNLGDWNHAFIGMLILLIASLPAFFSIDVRGLIWDLTQALSVWYLSKEYHSYQPKLGYVKAFFINLWARHDRRQSIIAWGLFWLYAFIFDKFIYDYIRNLL